MKRSVRRAIWIIFLPVVFCGAIEGGARVHPYPTANFARDRGQSVRYLDRDGRDLRITTVANSERALWCGIDEMGEWITKATIAIEDHRFESHTGIDPIGIIRAAVSNVRSGRIKAGGSTITQQLARLARPELRQMPGWKRKMHEAWDAFRIERSCSKREVLEQYLNRAPYGGRLLGVRAAAEVYFGKTPDRLSLAEAAYLAGLPQAPDAYSPYAHPERAHQRQRLVLWRMRKLGMIDEACFEQARRESIVVRPRVAEYFAPHFVNAIENGIFGAPPLPGKLLHGKPLLGKPVPGKPASREFATTLDLPLQAEVEGLVANHLARLAEKRATEAAVVVMDARTGEIRAWSGSSDFFRKSQIDGVLALRQPGSTLKPFTYGLAFENGRSPSDLVADVPMEESVGGFRPENFDRTYRGPVRMREALASSRNIPAVRVLRDDVGTENLLAFLRDAGMQSLDRDATHYGLALTLGAGEVRLIDLASAYAMLARGGVTVAPRAWPGEAEAEDERSHTDESVRGGRRILSREATAQVISILSDDMARRSAFGAGSALAFPFPVAVKTGTSKDFRDNWAVGCTPKHVVAVWVGNFDGSSMIDCAGVTGAAPLMHEIMMRIGRDDGDFERPTTLVAAEVCPLSGMKPGDYCPGRVKELFRSARVGDHECEFHKAQGVVTVPRRFKTDGFRRG